MDYIFFIRRRIFIHVRIVKPCNKRTMMYRDALLGPHGERELEMKKRERESETE